MNGSEASGRMTAWTAVLALAFMVAIGATATAEQRVALVIGNADYKDAPLNNPVNDARDVAAKLEQVGFTVILRENTTKQKMEQAISTFGEKLSEGSVALIFYSGHGMQVNGHNFLIPTDARISTEQQIRLQTVDVDVILDQMAAARTRVNLVVLDACRNNPFEHRFRGLSGGLAQMNAPEGTVIAYATAPGKVASDGEGRNGLYTEELLKAIDRPGIAIEEIFKHVRTGVIQRSSGAQTPWESSSLTGDFYFSSEKAATKAAPLAPESDKEALFWDTIKNSRNPASFKAYLAQYPHGTFAGLAAVRIEELTGKTKPAESATNNRTPRQVSELTPQSPQLPQSPPRPPQVNDERLDQLRAAAAAGKPRAELQLGHIYENGRLVPQNYAEALKWYRLAADHGIPQAFVAIGHLYENGLGVARDQSEAGRWYALAAERGAQPARERPSPARFGR